MSRTLRLNRLGWSSTLRMSKGKGQRQHVPACSVGMAKRLHISPSINVMRGLLGKSYRVEG